MDVQRTPVLSTRHALAAAFAGALTSSAGPDGAPLVLLAGEPTANLDSENGVPVMEPLRELHGYGATICIVTHDPDDAKPATRSIHLLDGHIADHTKSGATARVGAA
jgi:ABC-type lipoprotein export system ATPase subunit